MGAATSSALARSETRRLYILTAGCAVEVCSINAAAIKAVELHKYSGDIADAKVMQWQALAGRMMHIHKSAGYGAPAGSRGTQYQARSWGRTGCWSAPGASPDPSIALAGPSRDLVARCGDAAHLRPRVPPRLDAPGPIGRSKNFFDGRIQYLVLVCTCAVRRRRAFVKSHLRRCFASSFT